MMYKSAKDLLSLPVVDNEAEELARVAISEAIVALRRAGDAYGTDEYKELATGVFALSKYALTLACRARGVPVPSLDNNWWRVKEARDYYRALSTANKAYTCVSELLDIPIICVEKSTESRRAVAAAFRSLRKTRDLRGHPSYYVSCRETSRLAQIALNLVLEARGLPPTSDECLWWKLGDANAWFYQNSGLGKW